MSKDYKVNEILDNMLKTERSNSATFSECVDMALCLDRQCCIGDIDCDTGSQVETLIRFWNSIDKEKEIAGEKFKRQPIKLYIDSYGGDLISAFTIRDAIKTSVTPIWTVNVGRAYSAGFLIFISGHKRFAYQHSSFLCHEGSTGIGADAGKFRNYADFYVKQLDQMKDMILESCSGITEEMYEAHRKDDWWFSTEEAINLKICDKVVNRGFV